MENIDYDLLLQERPYDLDEIDGYVDLMAEACASRREYIRVNGEDLPMALVKKRFLNLDGEHIRYVMESLRNCTTHVVNIRAYTLAALYNAPRRSISITPRRLATTWRRAIGAHSRFWS